MESKEVFLIDDDETFVFLMKEVINSSEIKTNITEFNDGQEAINYFKNKKTVLFPDLIFLDLHMHIMDGWEFIKEFSEIESSIPKKIKLYVVSSSISPHDIERSKRYKVITDFVIKPLNDGKFIDIIENL